MTTESTHEAQRPSVVTVVGSSFLLVDDVQPRAQVLDVGTLSDSAVSWADRPPPREYVWPRRHVYADAVRAQIVDGPGTVSVELTLGGRGSVVVADVARDLPRGDVLRVARNQPWGSRKVEDTGGTWDCWSLMSGPAVRSFVLWTPRGAGGVRGYDLGRGGIAGAAAHDDVLVVTVRRADKRPWRYRPRFDVAVLRPDDPEPAWLPTPKADPATAWPTVEPDTAALDRALAEAEGMGRVVVEHGGGDVEVTVADGPDPVVSTWFDLPSRPGVRCVRRDEPYDELGLATGGLGRHGIFLEEDLEFDFMPGLAEARDGVLEV